MKIVYTAAVLLMMTSLPTSNAQNMLGQRLGQRMTEPQFTALSPIQALFRLSAEYRIPMGIVWINGSNSANPIDIVSRGMTVAQTLEKIASLMPDEKVDLEGPVVHVVNGQTNVKVPWLSIKFPVFTTVLGLIP